MAARYRVKASLCPASSALANSSTALFVSSAICWEFIWSLLEGFLFAFRGSAVCCYEKQTPFLEVPRRLAVRAVRGAGLAFTGAKRKPLTEEADGLGAGFDRKGS